MNFTNISGIIATVFSFCVSFGVIMQIRKVIRRKSSKDISLILYFIVMGSIISWWFYGLAIKSIPLILTNTFAFIVNTILVIVIFQYRK